MNKPMTTTIKKTRAQIEAEAVLEETPVSKWDTFDEPIWDSVSEKTYENRIGKAYEAGLEPCTICGRGVREGHGWMVKGIQGGGYFLRADLWDVWSETATADEQAGDMGCWILGPECGKKFPPAYRVRF